MSTYRSARVNAVRLVESVDDALLLALFLPPEIDLLPLGSGTIRIDDLLMAIIIMRHSGYLRFVPAWLQRSILWVLVVSVVSLILAVGAGRVSYLSGVLYTIRPFEYMAGLLLGVSIARQKHTEHLKRQLSLVAATLAGMSVLQTAGIHIGVSRFSYGRAAGNLDGPYVLAAVSGVLLFTFLGWKRPWTAFVCVVPLLLSASRVTIVGAAVLLLLGARRSIPRSAKIFAMFTCAIAAPLIVLAAGVQSVNESGSQGNSILSRLSTTHLVAGLQSGCKYADGVGPIRSQADYFAAGYVNLLSPGTLTDSDTSSQVRFARWCLLLKGMRSPDTVAFGYGPSFAGAAVDGQYVRYVVEQGLAGLAAWLTLWFRCVRRASPSTRNAALIMLVSALFIDILSSSRAMVLLWILVGVALTRLDFDRRTHAEISVRGPGAPGLQQSET